VEAELSHDCFEAFEEVSKEKYCTAQDLAAIEFAVAPLRNRRALTYRDLKDFESPRNWEFKTWWVFPPEQHLTPELQSREFNFQNLPEDEEGVIASLLQVFKSIELVSIILRFVRPEQCCTSVRPSSESSTCAVKAMRSKLT
jgi:hypothetical protein